MNERTFTDEWQRIALALTLTIAVLGTALAIAFT